jgi:nitroreductase
VASGPQPALSDELAGILSRRSARELRGPAPTEAQLDAILQAALTVPDHGVLRPWRLVVVAGNARAAFGDALAAAVREHRPDLDARVADRVRAKAFAAPMLIAFGAKIDRSARVPEWEQVASAACLGYAMVLAAHQLGLGAMWKSIPFTESRALRHVLDLGAHDRFLGWVNVGHVAGGATGAAPRPRLDPSAVVRHLDGTGSPRALV